MIEIVNSGNLLTPHELTWLRDHAAAAGEALGARGEVRIRLVGDEEMAAAHGKWSGDPTTTDVLTFDMGTAGAALDVDVWACVDEARREAATRGHAVEREVLLYVLHAMLHCLGYDDTDDDSFARMHAREDEVLRAIGVGETFAAPASAAVSKGAAA